MAELATERLTLRAAGPDDVASIVALAGDARVAEMTCFVPHPLPRASVEEWLRSLRPSPMEPGEYVFAICRKPDNEFMGVVSLRRDRDRPNADIGYWLGCAYWGQGYATEAVRRVLRAAFGEFGLKSIEASVFPGNARSMKVLTKAGFEETGRGIRCAPARGGDREAVLFTATRASFARAALSQAVGRS